MKKIFRCTITTYLMNNERNVPDEESTYFLSVREYRVTDIVKTRTNLWLCLLGLTGKQAQQEPFDSHPSMAEEVDLSY